jgi:hypothetical protein
VEEISGLLWELQKRVERRSLAMGNKSAIVKLLLLICSLVMTSMACEQGNRSHGMVSLDPIKNIPESVWRKLDEKKIYFGHQSVGQNIIEGLEHIKRDNPQIKLKIVTISNASELSGPMFAHSSLGENADPHSKMKDFSDYLEKGIGNRADIAFFKFCYADIKANSDVEKLFTEYKTTMEDLKKKYPRTRFIHVTVPLMVSQTTLKTFIKRVVGRKDNNIQRNRFNEMLRQEYDGKEPLFDIAKAESTYPDGSRSSFVKGAGTYYSLVPDYADDGGHLNEQGRRLVAQELLIVLAQLVQE